MDNDVGVSESRFYMWRAVFAMAHADEVVTAEEQAFMESYLEKVPFSSKQLSILKGDIKDAQDIHEMFSMISESEDLSQFFEFSRALVWCDGDYEEQEREIKERLKAEHVGKLNVELVETELRRSRSESRKKRTAELRELKEDANKRVGLKKMIKGMLRRKS